LPGSVAQLGSGVGNGNGNGIGIGLTIVVADGREGVDDLARRDGTSGVDGIGGDHPIMSRAQDLRHAVDGKLELTLEDVGDLVVGMRMLRQIDVRVDQSG